MDSMSAMQMKRSNRHVAQALISPALLGLAWLVHPAPAQALPNPQGQSTITMPAAGVVCDGTNQLCYDRNGLSLALTRTYFGQYAERIAKQNFGLRLPQHRFELSNGVICQTVQQSCWRVKHGQRVQAGRIRNQLFAQGPTPFPSPSPYPQPAPSPSGATGLCRLMRGGEQLFNGSCALREIRQGFDPRFEVQLRQGPTYVFVQTNRGYVIGDSMGGRWPVTMEDRGNSGIFRWGDYRLDVTQRNYRPDYGNSSKFQRAVNNFLMDLFN